MKNGELEREEEIVFREVVKESTTEMRKLMTREKICFVIHSHMHTQYTHACVREHVIYQRSYTPKMYDRPSKWLIHFVKHDLHVPNCLWVENHMVWRFCLSTKMSKLMFLIIFEKLARTLA